MESILLNGLDLLPTFSLREFLQFLTQNRKLQIVSFALINRNRTYQIHDFFNFPLNLIDYWNSND
jgi:hypothetical protein